MGEDGSLPHLPWDAGVPRAQTPPWLSPSEPSRPHPLCFHLQLLGQQLPRITVPPVSACLQIPSSVFCCLSSWAAHTPAPQIQPVPDTALHSKLAWLDFALCFRALPLTQSLRPKIWKEPSVPLQHIHQLPEETQGFPNWVIRLPSRLCPRLGHPSGSTWKSLPQ